MLEPGPSLSEEPHEANTPPPGPLPSEEPHEASTPPPDLTPTEESHEVNTPPRLAGAAAASEEACEGSVQPAPASAPEQLPAASAREGLGAGAPPQEDFIPSSEPIEKEEAAEMLERCMPILRDTAVVEERAMIFDRAGAYPGAIEQYRVAAGMLAHAACLCPSSHPDAFVIDCHSVEVRARADYLESLGVLPAEIPVEEHIHGAQLTMGSAQAHALDKKNTLSAATVGGVAGMLLLGPHVVAVGVVGAAAAYSTTRQDAVGKASRTLGDAGLWAFDRAKSSESVANAKRSVKDTTRVVDEKLGVSQTVRAVDERLSLSEKARSSAEALRAADEQYAIREKAQALAEKASVASQAAAARTAEALVELNDQYKVTGKLSEGFATAASAVTGWISKATGSGQARDS